MKAQQARDIAESFTRGRMDSIYQDIEQHAKCGSTSCCFSDWQLDREQVDYLKTQGYSVSFDSNMLEWEVSW